MKYKNEIKYIITIHKPFKDDITIENEKLVFNRTAPFSNGQCWQGMQCMVSGASYEKIYKNLEKISDLIEEIDILNKPEKFKYEDLML